jgi:ELWxxDGT repeat protein
VLVRDISTGSLTSFLGGPVGPAGSNPSDLTNVKGTLYFAADDGVHGEELWKSDGTAKGTVLVKDINPGRAAPVPLAPPVPSSSYPSGLTAVNGTVYFMADDGVHGYELWKSDGTAKGTVMVRDLYPGIGGVEPGEPNSSVPGNLTPMGGTLYFTANDGVHGQELWKTDGTAKGTVLVKDINPGRDDGFLGLTGCLANVNGVLVMAAIDPRHGEELWKSDGTAAGTVLMRDIDPGTPWGVNMQPYPDSIATSSFLNVKGTVFFVATDGAHGLELWKAVLPR